jgi:hypothetical protein
MKWYAPHARQVLFSSEHGYFVWTPLAFVALRRVDRACAFPAWCERAEANRVGRVLLAVLMFLLQIYISGSVDSWTVAAGSGSGGSSRSDGARDR